MVEDDMANAQPPVFRVGLEEALVQRVGTKLQLQVTVEDQSEKVFFEWRGPSGSQNTEEGRVVITETGNTSTAEITPLHLQDQGLWTCSAKNKHGVTQTMCNVLAQVPKSYKTPVFLEELVAGLTQQGTVSLECKVVGIPSPSLRWFRDGEEIRSGDVFALQASMERPVSVYRCDATNCMGTLSSTAVLDVTKSLSEETKPAPTLTEPLIDKKVKIGELVELAIAVSRVCLPVRVVWWNHGSQIAEGDKYSVVENAEGRFSVIMNPVELCDDGEWRVTVENQQGTVASECTLTLRVPKNYRKPRFVENLKAVLTKEGLVSFECKVVGYPTPVLRWFKDGAELKPGDVYQLSGSRSLGTYSCLARNCMGEAVSTAALTVEDIGEKFPDSKSELGFLVSLQDASVKIGDKHRFSSQVTYNPCLEIAWHNKDEIVMNNERVVLSKEDGGFYHCDVDPIMLEDEGTWRVVAKDSENEIDTSCQLTVTIPKHYKKPKFLEPLKAVLTEEGAVNLECKVIGVPQPTLSWYKDGVELKAGDIHRLMSGRDGSCCLGTYTCVATNCMGKITSSAALLGFEEAVTEEEEVDQPAIAHDIMTPDISDGNIKPFSLSTIQEERTSQMMSPEAAQHTETLRQSSIEEEQISIISVGKVDEEGELSLSIGNQELTLSLYQTPDLSEKDAKNICEMFADELAESITESKYVELPPLRFTKETAKASNITMEAVIIDIDKQDLEEYHSMKNALENIDDLQTECDVDDVSMAEWIDEPAKGAEFETRICEEIFDLDTQDLVADPLLEESDIVIKQYGDAISTEHGNLEGIPFNMIHRDSQTVLSREHVEADITTSMKTEEILPVKSDLKETIQVQAEDLCWTEKSTEEGFVLIEEKSVETNRVREDIVQIVATTVNVDTIESKSFDVTEDVMSHKIDSVRTFDSEEKVGLKKDNIVIEDIAFDDRQLHDYVICESKDPIKETDVSIEETQITESDVDQLRTIKKLVELEKPSKGDQQGRLISSSEDPVLDARESITQEHDLVVENIDGGAQVVYSESVLISEESISQPETSPDKSTEKDTTVFAITSKQEEKELEQDHKSFRDIQMEEQTPSKDSIQEDNSKDKTKKEPISSHLVDKTVHKIIDKSEDTSEEDILQEATQGRDILENVLKTETKDSGNKLEESTPDQNNKTSLEGKDVVFQLPDSDQISKSQIDKSMKPPEEIDQSVAKDITVVEDKTDTIVETSSERLGEIEHMEVGEGEITDTTVSRDEKAVILVKTEIEKEEGNSFVKVVSEESIVPPVDTGKTSKGVLSESASRKNSKKQPIKEGGLDDIKLPSRKNSKKHSRQESIVDSEEVPDIETYNEDDNGFMILENKDLLSNEDDLEMDRDWEAQPRERRKSSYEKTLEGMDPGILAELGVSPVPEKKGIESNKAMNIDQDDEAYKRERRQSSYEKTLEGMDPEILAELGISPVPEKKGLESNEAMNIDQDDEAYKRERRQSSYEKTLEGMDPEILAEIGISPVHEKKDLDSSDIDQEFEAYKRERRKSSYEEALEGMDPDILAELGISPIPGEKGAESAEPLDLTQLPTETTLERMSRIEEKASMIVLEDDPTARKSRSRSRSRSKSRPPNLDTVIEKRSEEVEEARYYEGLLAQPSLDTIKESPSTASMAGILAGGFSSASVNTVLEASHSAASVHTIIGVHEEPIVTSPSLEEKNKHKSSKIEEIISEEKGGSLTSDSGPKETAVEETPRKKPKKKAKRSETVSLVSGDEVNVVTGKSIKEDVQQHGNLTCDEKKMRQESKRRTDEEEEGKTEKRKIEEDKIKEEDRYRYEEEERKAAVQISAAEKSLKEVEQKKKEEEERKTDEITKLEEEKRKAEIAKKKLNENLKAEEEERINKEKLKTEEEVRKVKERKKAEKEERIAERIRKAEEMERNEEEKRKTEVVEKKEKEQKKIESERKANEKIQSEAIECKVKGEKEADQSERRRNEKITNAEELKNKEEKSKGGEKIQTADEIMIDIVEIKADMAMQKAEEISKPEEVERKMKETKDTMKEGQKVGEITDMKQEKRAMEEKILAEEKKRKTDEKKKVEKEASGMKTTNTKDDNQRKEENLNSKKSLTEQKEKKIKMGEVAKKEDKGEDEIIKDNVKGKLMKEEESSKIDIVHEDISNKKMLFIPGYIEKQSSLESFEIGSEYDMTVDDDKKIIAIEIASKDETEKELVKVELGSLDINEEHMMEETRNEVNISKISLEGVESNKGEERPHDIVLGEEQKEKDFKEKGSKEKPKSEDIGVDEESKKVLQGKQKTVGVDKVSGDITLDPKDKISKREEELKCDSESVRKAEEEIEKHAKDTNIQKQGHANERQIIPGILIDEEKEMKENENHYLEKAMNKAEQEKHFFEEEVKKTEEKRKTEEKKIKELDKIKTEEAQRKEFEKVQIGEMERKQEEKRHVEENEREAQHRKMKEKDEKQSNEKRKAEKEERISQTKKKMGEENKTKENHKITEAALMEKKREEREVTEEENIKSKEAIEKLEKENILLEEKREILKGDRKKAEDRTKSGEQVKNTEKESLKEGKIKAAEEEIYVENIKIKKEDREETEIKAKEEIVNEDDEAINAKAKEEKNKLEEDIKKLKEKKTHKADPDEKNKYEMNNLKDEERQKTQSEKEYIMIEGIEKRNAEEAEKLQRDNIDQTGGDEEATEDVGKHGTKEEEGIKHATKEERTEEEAVKRRREEQNTSELEKRKDKNKTHLTSKGRDVSKKKKNKLKILEESEIVDVKTSEDKNQTVINKKHEEETNLSTRKSEKPDSEQIKVESTVKKGGEKATEKTLAQEKTKSDNVREISSVSEVLDSKESRRKHEKSHPTNVAIEDKSIQRESPHKSKSEHLEKSTHTENGDTDDESSEDLITLKDVLEVEPISKISYSKASDPHKFDSQNAPKGGSRVPENLSLEGRARYDVVDRKASSTTYYNSQEMESDHSEFSSVARYKTVVSPVDSVDYRAETSYRRRSQASPDMHGQTTPYIKYGQSTPDMMYKYDSTSGRSVSRQDMRDSQLSPTFDSRSRNISGGGESGLTYRDTLEKSRQTPQNVMAVVTGSLVNKAASDQTPAKTRPPSSASAKTRPANEPSKEAAMRKKLEMEKASVAGSVTDIMIKEVGSNWVSLCWKKPGSNRGSPVMTYKVESWLCGEGAFWVELGRTPIPQFDAFNLKPNKCYHFRVTARNKRGWGESLMTRHKVDLSRPTHMPTITSEMDPVMKALAGSPLKLSIQVSGEPRPTVTWQKDGSTDMSQLPGVTVTEDDMGSHIDISSLERSTSGKYTVTAVNLAGRAMKSVLVQSLENKEVFEAYQKFKRWQSLVPSPMAPFLVNSPRDRRVQAGQSIQLTCRVVSNPWPVVHWFKDDEPLVPDDFTSIYAEADYQHVQIDDLTLDHSGKYCVEAFNEHGSVRCHFVLIVDSGLDRYMPPFFTRELRDMVVRRGNNLLLDCRVESFPYIGVTWHQSGSKIRTSEAEAKTIDEDGNVVLVLCNVTNSHAYTVSILNEVAENSSSCHVTVMEDTELDMQDEDLIKHALGPRFVTWPNNQDLEEGSNLLVECQVEGVQTVLLSRDFMPKSVDTSIIQLVRGPDNWWSVTIPNLELEDGGLYFLTARNSCSEEKYPVFIKVRARASQQLQVSDSAPEDGVGAPQLSQMGPLLVRDGDDVVLKTCLLGGEGPLDLQWYFDQEEVVWTYRVSPYNRTGCVGIKLMKVGRDDEGTYSCRVTNQHGQAIFTTTLLVDFAEQRESEVMEELCNCPMLDPFTPVMSWTNTPNATPRRTPMRTPMRTPYATPLMTPCATPRSTPRATPRSTPVPSAGLNPSYGPRDFRSASRGVGEDIMPVPPRRKFVQAPEIFSSFSNKQAEEGSLVELKCFISCAPITSTTWEKDNLPLLSGVQVTISEKTGVRTMTIHSVKPGDSGNYRVTVSNSSGSASCSATVSVKKKSSSSSYYYSSGRLSVPKSPYNSLSRSSAGRSSSSYSSNTAYSTYSSYRSYL